MELDIDRKRITRLITGISPDGQVNDQYDGWYLITVIPVIYGLNKEGKEEGRTNPDKMDPKSRKDWYDGTDTKIKLEEKTSLVIPAEEVRRGMATLANDIVQEFEKLPQLFEHDCGFDADVIQIARDAVDRVRMMAKHATNFLDQLGD